MGTKPYNLSVAFYKVDPELCLLVYNHHEYYWFTYNVGPPVISWFMNH